MFDWQAIGTHAVEMLVGGVGTWLFQSINHAHRRINRLQNDMDACFIKIRDIQFDLKIKGESDE